MISWLLLGPSGVGKSTLGASLADHLPGHAFVDLDLLMAQAYGVADLSDCLLAWGLEPFYRRSLDCLAQLEADSARLLVAIGAGSQLAASGRRELLLAPSLCLWADPSWLLARNRRLRGDARRLSDFIATEYSPFRQALYEAADQLLDLSGKSRHEALALMLESLHQPAPPKRSEAP